MSVWVDSADFVQKPQIQIIRMDAVSAIRSRDHNTSMCFCIQHGREAFETCA